MNRAAILLTLSIACHPATAKDQVSRPHITGIDHVRIYVSDANKTNEFYTKIVGLSSRRSGCTGIWRPCFPVNSSQRIEIQPVPSPAPKNWLAEVAFATDDVVQMRRYLQANGVAASAITKDPNAARHFELRDPEGNPISFVQPSEFSASRGRSEDQVGRHLLHAGFVVRDAALEDHFYRDLLGFRMYWHGGFKDADVDWEEIQVPDGNDWIEYMLNISPTADHKELGIQNHFSLGVESANSAAIQLRAHGLKSFDGPEIGRDGKDSLDAYDPDATRVEFMEFRPVQKPCCHPYEAAHPKP
jgi:catechol 2,3-dioxygenase-like lactoylglutathione lyase family enzyme